MKNIKSTQDYVPIKDVSNGTIITDDGRFVKVLEIKPINLNLKSKEEQDALYRAYAGLIKSAPSRFSIKCITKDTPVSEYMQEYLGSCDFEKSERCKEYIKAHAEFVNMLSSRQSTDHAMYFIFEYDQENDYYRSLTDQERLDSMQNTERNIISEFSSLGNTVFEHAEPDIDVCELLYSLYNRRIYLEESFQKRLKRISKDRTFAYETLNKAQPPFVNLRDILAPRSINTCDGADYLLVDGLYCSYFYVDRDGFPSEIISGGWLAALINFGYGVDVDMFFERKDSIEALQKIHKKSRLTRIKRNSREINAPDMEEINDNLEALAFMRDALKRTSEEIYSMSIMVSVYAYTKEDLYIKKDALLRFAKREDIDLIELKYVEELGLIASAPLNMMPKELSKVSRHDVYTSVIAAAYPFTSYSLMDEGGILMGIHEYNNSLVVFNPFDSKKYSNANICVFGSPGKGKTFTLLSMTTRLRYKGVQVFIIAPDKQDEFRRVTTALDGEFVSVSPAADTRINPFDIWPVDSAADQLINGKTGNETSWLIDKIDSLGKWTEMMVPGISIQDKARIKLCLSRMYAHKGITKDNDSIYLDANRLRKKEMPIFTDFVRELKNEQSLSPAIVAVFEQFTKKDGAYRNLNGPTNVDLENKYIVFGLEHLNSELKAPMMFILLKFIWAVAKADKTKNKAVVIDEGSLLVSGKDESVGDFVVEVFRMIRGYGGSAIFATQTVADLYKNGGEFGNAILACSYSHILLGMQPGDVRLVKKELELTSSEEIAIKDFSKPGQALLCAGSAHIPVLIKASNKEFDLFTTEAKEYQRLLRENAKFNPSD